MVYKLRWKKGNKTFESKKTFRTKGTAEKKVSFLRQLDDDLPKSQRDKSLKSFNVVKVPITKRIIKRARMKF